MFRIKRNIIALLSSVLGMGMVWAQDDADLLRYSMLNPVGTARFNAMGGAFGALGANFTTLSTNPAGIGFYTRHEISLSLGTTTQSTSTLYYGEKNSLEKTRITMPQGGGIFCIKNGNKNNNAWSLQLGFGANRVKDFNKNVYIEGINPQSSYMQDVAARSAGWDFAVQNQDVAHIGNLAYTTGLIDYLDTVNYTYESFLGGGLSQKRILQERGNITEMVFSFGGNYSEKLYFGITLGLPVVDYRQTSETEENNTENQPLPHSFRSYTLRNRMEVSGTGLNLKLGLIYKPVSFFRVGVAFHTPTYYWLKESANVNLNTNMRYILSDNSLLPNQASYSYSDSYQLSSPMKGIFSMAFLVKNFGAISLEGELINYRQMRMDVDDDVDYNKYISDIVRENYKMAGVLRFGTEWKVSIVSFRAGYIWQSCPYKNELLKKHWSNNTMTVGLGLTLGRWNIDFGFMADLGKRTDNDFYYLLGSDGTPLINPARLVLNKCLFTLSGSCRF